MCRRIVCVAISDYWRKVRCSWICRMIALGLSEGGSQAQARAVVRCRGQNVTRGTQKFRTQRVLVNSGQRAFRVGGGGWVVDRLPDSKFTVESRRLRLRHDVRALDGTFTYNSSFIS